MKAMKGRCDFPITTTDFSIKVQSIKARGVSRRWFLQRSDAAAGQALAEGGGRRRDAGA